MTISLKEEMFVEDADLRNIHINKVEVLDKVKVLSLLPDNEHMTIKMVADY